MTLRFKNKHIFFALESIWARLDYKFKYYIHLLVNAQPEDEFEQEIDIPESELLNIIGALTALPEGVSSFVNDELLKTLVPQLQAQSNLEEVVTWQPPELVEVPEGEEQPELPTAPVANEAARILLRIAEIKAANQSLRDQKILSGKNKILA